MVPKHTVAGFGSIGEENLLLFPASEQLPQSERKVRSRERLGGLLRFYHREADISVGSMSSRHGPANQTPVRDSTRPKLPSEQLSLLNTELNPDPGARMPLFTVAKTTLSPVDQTNFATEKILQALIESNLESVFGCRFVATEFTTGAQHAGRIDTLALSEDHNPVIIEYKKVESSELINQSLFYLAWIQDHQGDFEIAAQKSLGDKVEVDWSDIRVICLAPNYKKYDLHAVQVMGANLELWTYRLFENSSLYLEEVFQKSITTSQSGSPFGKGLTAGQKAALSRKTGSYTVQQHFKDKPVSMKELARTIQEFLLGLDPAIEEVPKKGYITYKISQNIACMMIRKDRVLLYVKLNLKELAPNVYPKKLVRDVTNIGHYGTGDLELSVRSQNDLKLVKRLLERAYQKVGG